jgi:hypothetical protein
VRPVLRARKGLRSGLELCLNRNAILAEDLHGAFHIRRDRNTGIGRKSSRCCGNQRHTHRLAVDQEDSGSGHYGGVHCAVIIQCDVDGDHSPGRNQFNAVGPRIHPRAAIRAGVGFVGCGGGRKGSVAQIGRRAECPFFRTDLSCDLRDWDAERGVAVQHGDTDLELRDLTVEVPRRKALTQEFDAVHLRFDAASAVISAPSSP